MTPDLVHDYEYNLRNALSRLNNDPLLRAEDRKLVLAFLAHIKAQGVSTGRAGEVRQYAPNRLKDAPPPLEKARRKDIEDLMTKLADHVSTHPYRNDPNAPLWLTTSTNNLNEPMGWTAADRLVKEAGARVGIKKARCHMYMFRHGSATRNARFLTDAEMRLMFGWSPGSKVPGRYIHLSGGDLDEKYQQVYGSGRPAEPPKPEFAPLVCPRCQDKASPGMRYCPKCATPLEQEEKRRAAAQEAMTRQEISELRKLVEKSLHPPVSGAGPGSSEARSS